MTFFSDPDTITGGIPQSEPTELARLRIQNQRLLAACKTFRSDIARAKELGRISQPLAMNLLERLDRVIAATQQGEE